MKINNKKAAGFTLLELLVVIAIIGLVSTITLTMIYMSRNRAKKSRIVSDLGQIRKAAELFYNNNNYSYANEDLGIYLEDDLDISTLNLAIHVSWEDTKKTSIQDIKIAAGGVPETSIRLKKTESFLRSKSISQDTLRKAVQVLHQEFTPLTDLRGSDAYRHLVIENYFNRFFTEVAEEQVQ